jgi:hypothetical protein
MTVTVGHWLPPQGLTARAIGDGASDEVKDDGSRATVGYCLGIIDKSFFHSLEQGKLGAPESKLLASAYSTASPCIGRHSGSFLIA